MPSYQKTCKYCGKEFTTNFPNKCYCTAICRKNEEKKLIKQKRGYENKNNQARECLYCGQSFITKNVLQKFCCKSHKNRYYLSSLENKEVICSVCSQPFTTNRLKKTTCPECTKAIKLQAISQEAQEILEKRREALANRKERIRQQREEEQSKERIKRIREEQNAIISMVDNGQSSMCRSSFRDGICDTSAFDAHYKWASHGEYIHSADFNLGF